MFEERDISAVRSDMALREGLRDLPSPEPSPDFDLRVLAALRQPLSWRQTLLASLRPILSSAACSMTVMLVALYWSSKTPIQDRPSSTSGSLMAHNSRDSMTVEMLLDRIADENRSIFAMRPLPIHQVAPIPPPEAPPGPTHRQPKRHSQSHPVPTVKEVTS